MTSGRFGEGVWFIVYMPMMAFKHGVEIHEVLEVIHSWNLFQYKICGAMPPHAKLLELLFWGILHSVLLVVTTPEEFCV